MSLIKKLFLINKIGEKNNIACEILDIIKNYSFYDIIKVTKLKKMEIDYIINNTLVFYNFKYVQNNRYSHFGILTMDFDKPNVHIKNDICNRCGNYYNWNLPKNIICKCI